MVRDAFFGNRALYEITWENMVELGQATDDDMAHAQFSYYCLCTKLQQILSCWTLIWRS